MNKQIPAPVAKIGDVVIYKEDEDLVKQGVIKEAVFGLLYWIYYVEGEEDSVEEEILENLTPGS